MLISIIFSVNHTKTKELEKDAYISPLLNIINLDAQLYFVDSNKLKMEKRAILIEDESIEEAILNYLSHGAKNQNYKTIFDYNFKLEDINIIDNICYVNLKINKNGYSLFNDKDFHLYAWSIVNTLTEQDNILKVQLLFNGEKFNKNLYSYNLRDPLPRLEGLMSKEKDFPSDIVKKFLRYISIERYDLAYGLISESSKSNTSYEKFKVISNKLNEDMTGLTLYIHFTQNYKDYWNVVYKYNDINGSPVYKYWKVIKEDGFFKIVLL